MANGGRRNVAAQISQSASRPVPVIPKRRLAHLVLSHGEYQAGGSTWGGPKREILFQDFGGDCCLEPPVAPAPAENQAAENRIRPAGTAWFSDQSARPEIRRRMLGRRVPTQCCRHVEMSLRQLGQLRMGCLWRNTAWWLPHSRIPIG